jgi:RimJ/RimL family protein N-acetyltransferase
MSEPKIRQITSDDAAAFIDLRTRLDHETKFMLLEPGERNETVEQTEKLIRDIKHSHNRMIWVAEDQGYLVGSISLIGGHRNRNCHTGLIVIGILQEYTGKGLGKRLFIEMEKWAKDHNIHRLQLTVMAHNERGIKLYQRMGFEIEGLEKHALRVDGEYVDEYMMAKLIS